jgi:hypothetical protein
MKRKSAWVGVTLALVVFAVCAVLALMLKHRPDFYVKKALPAGKERKQLSGKFMQEFNEFYRQVKTREWGAQFDEPTINGFFAEHFIQTGLAERILPEGVSDPRVAIEQDKLRVGFRYGTGVFSTIISIDLRLWLAPRAPNVVVLELQGLHAGALPISAQSLLDQISEAARQNNIDVTWYRHGRNPVALLRFQADQDRPTIQLEQLTLHAGLLDFHGKSLVASAAPPVAAPVEGQPPKELQKSD